MLGPSFRENIQKQKKKKKKQNITEKKIFNKTKNH